MEGRADFSEKVPLPSKPPLSPKAFTKEQGRSEPLNAVHSVLVLQTPCVCRVFSIKSGIFDETYKFSNKIFPAKTVFFIVQH